jgi:dTDP-4-dehydrorhamnose 3,5-epimerase
MAGRIRVCLHDMRTESTTFGVTQSIDMPGDASLGIYIPPGVAHGFSALEDSTLTYLVDRYFDASDEFGVAWNDPTIAFDWGVTDPILSDRDQQNPTLVELGLSRER